MKWTNRQTVTLFQWDLIPIWKLEKWMGSRDEFSNIVLSSTWDNDPYATGPMSSLTFVESALFLRWQFWSGWRREALKSLSGVSSHCYFNQPQSGLWSTSMVRSTLVRKFPSARIICFCFSTIDATIYWSRSLHITLLVQYNIFISIIMRRRSLPLVVSQHDGTIEGNWCCDRFWI